ncbi:unknown protein [Seminavis robusta]|uniref:VWFD domain-containing protein n=1 Tax=Seminavis robusta TaxID=568900 RepID=A0A9N8ELA0_9STRA|nr:unknown protein [Seminavis robusta]|eukprot:Sro1402_g269581.1  (398) ;mRNA; f:21443-22749
MKPFLYPTIMILSFVVGQAQASGECCYIAVGIVDSSCDLCTPGSCVGTDVQCISSTQNNCDERFASWCPDDTGAPTPSPTSYPSYSPTAEPTTSPTAYPSYSPTAEPTTSPTAGPTTSPTDSPTAGPTESSTEGTTDIPATDPVPTSTSAGGGGDPHFKTWNSTWYDFHGICDLVLLDDENFANGLGLTIHIRTKDRYPYAYIESAALQIGEDILEVSSFGEYMMDGVSKVDMPAEMGGQFLVDHEQKSDKEHTFTIKVGESEAIKLSTFKDMVTVMIENGSSADFGTSVGLMGKFGDGALLARDGTTVIGDHNLFGQEWQVLASEPQLFQTSSQFLGKRCVPPATTKGRRRLGVTISKDAAEKACDHHKDMKMQDMCVFDVIAMGDLEVAHAHGAF